MPLQDYNQIVRLVRSLDDSDLTLENLELTAGRSGLNPAELERLFLSYAAISAKEFFQRSSRLRIRQLLREPALEQVAEATCLSSQGNRYQLPLSIKTCTPGEMPGVQISYGIHPTRFGDCLLAKYEQGICRLEFLDAGNREEILEAFQSDWPQATLREDPAATVAPMKQIFAPQQSTHLEPLELLLVGTDFQIKVWNTLLKIGCGCVTSYKVLAEQIGRPKASRAIGSAVGKNPIGYLIPCHRVLRSDGALGGYRWGLERKRILLGCELCS